MALIKLLFLCFLLFLIFGSIGSFFIFAIDVIKWHKREERVKVVPSAGDPADNLKESEVISYGESERSDNGIGGSDPYTPAADPTGSGQPDSSAIFNSWL